MSDPPVHAGSEHHVSRMTKYKSVLAVFTGLTVLMLYTAYALFNGQQGTVLVQFEDSPQAGFPVELQNILPSAQTKIPKVRVLCLILTMEKDISTKVAAVNKTWATRCDKHFYVIYSKIKRRDFLNVDIPDNRNNLVHKMRRVYEIIYERHLRDFDFLLKADDDSYVIVENLKLLLSNYKRYKPGYLGYHFNKFVKQGYMSGGAGYVISNKGLRDLVKKGYQKGLCEVVPHEDDPENSEDIETGRCLEKAGVPVLSSLDTQGRETFHPYPLEKYLHGNLPGYIYSWAKNPVVTGEKCCGRFMISFHYVSPDAMVFMHHLLYNTAVYGFNVPMVDETPFKNASVT